MNFNEQSAKNSQANTSGKVEDKRGDDRAEASTERRSERRSERRPDRQRSALSAIGRRLSSTQTDLGAMEEVAEILTNLSKEPANLAVLETKVVPLVTQNLHAPIMLIAAKGEVDGRMAIYYLPIIMEGLGRGILEPHVTKNNRGDSEIMDRPSAAIFDAAAVQWAESELAEAFAVEEAEFYYGAQVVYPSRTDVKDEGVLGSVYISALNWLADIMGGAAEKIDYDLLTEEGINLVQEPLEVVRGTVHDPLGNPVAADFISTMTLVEESQDRRDVDDYLDINRADQVDSLPVVTTAIQVDFVLDDNFQAEPQRLIDAEPQRRNFQGYIPTIIMTACHNSRKQGNRVEDITTQLFGLISCLPVTVGYGWVRAWEHQPKNAHKNNLGLLAREWDPTLSGLEGKEVTLTVSSGDEPKAGQVRPIDFAKAFVHDGALLAMDFTMGSYSAPYQAVFSDAAKFDSRKAIDEIYNAADEITDGVFSRLVQDKFGDLPNPMMPETNTLHGGSYDTKNGRRDLRDFDYLTALKVADSDRNLLIDATQSVYQPGVETVESQTLRRNVIMKAVHDGEINTLVTRVYFENWFAPMLVEALEEAGVSILNDDENPYVEMRGDRRGLSAKRYASNFRNTDNFYRDRRAGKRSSRRSGFTGGGTGRYFA